MTKLLDEYADEWNKCDRFIIEEQLSFGTLLNIKLAQHCWSYFSIKYGDKIVLNFPSSNKTQILGAPKNKKILKSGKVIL